MPAPMMQPTPNAVSETGPSTRCKRCSPAISASNSSKSFFAKMCFQLMRFEGLGFYLGAREYTGGKLAFVANRMR